MFRAVIIGGLLLLALLGVLLVWRLQPEQALAVPPGGEIRYGDFGFTVDRVRRASSISGGGGVLVARGEFVIQTLRVQNHGQRIDFTFDASVVRLIASDGEVYLADAAGTAALALGDAAATSGGRRCSGPIRPGDSCTAEIPFDVPMGTKAMRMEMQFEGPIFEFVEMLIRGRRWLVLQE